MKIKSAEERNADFRRMNKVERRKEVAADALAQLRAGRYEATTGIYEFLFLHDGTVSLGGSASRIGESLPATARCECCAKGALMISAVRCFDAAPVKSDDDYRGAVLAEIFGPRTADLAEDAFEGNDGNDALAQGDAEAFACAFPSDRKRLTQILLLILSHPEGQLTQAALLAAIKKPLALKEVQA